MKRITGERRAVSGRKLVSMALTIVLAAGGAFAGTSAANHTSSDVPTGNFFHESIGWLIDQNIANGYPDGTFKPNNPISRAQLAFWLGNYNDSLEMVSSTDTAGSTVGMVADVLCPSGKYAVAGSGSTGVTDAMMTSSGPIGNDWTVRWEKDNNGAFSVGVDSATAYALCIPLPVGFAAP